MKTKQKNKIKQDLSKVDMKFQHKPIKILSDIESLMTKFQDLILSIQQTGLIKFISYFNNLNIFVQAFFFLMLFIYCLIFHHYRSYLKLNIN